MTTHQGSRLFSKGLKRTALSVALSMSVAAGVQAQSTTGSIYGSVPAGTTITVTSSTGLTRTVTADESGRYNISSLPVGIYTVDASGVGKKDVTVTVGSGANVSFGGSATDLGTITVRGTSVPVIDVKATDTRTVITAEQLRRLPIARSAEAIALLSPGAVTGNGANFGGQISFGGSSVAENAYYLNGYFSGNPMTNVGGFTLPYGSIEQQETYTGGYGARYGRSSGGVISQIGKSGSNDWHFGGQVVYTPRGLKAERPDRYFPNLGLPADYSYATPELAGTKYDSGDNRLQWSNVYSAYVGGPIIKDKLFFFVSGETTKGKENVPGGNPDAGFAATGSRYNTDDPKVYAKVNWNITDNHLLEATYVSEKYDQTGNTYGFDWDSYAYGDYLIPATKTTSNTEFSVFKYTGYLTDNLTLSASYGRSRNRYNTDPYLTGSPYIAGASSQNPSLNGGTPNTNSQATYRATKSTSDYTNGFRAELEWVLGDHTLIAGVDNTKLEGVNEGTSQVADYWAYGKAASSASNSSAALGVGPTGTVAGACNGTPNRANANGSSTNCGYYTYQLKYFDTTSMHNKQNAYYLEDRWQITDNFLVSLGIRADQYENFDAVGTKFVDSGTQWQPRLGFAWDVYGDSSLKVFANAGRYFLNMPNAVAIRGVGASTYTREYYTYTGIADDGTPTGLTPINRIGTNTPAGPVSSNGEFGTPKDPLTYVPEDIKSQYQDEFSIGFEAQLTENWTGGAKFTSRKLKSAIDDFCDPVTLMEGAGLEVLNYDYSRAAYIGQSEDGKYYAGSACYMFNPGGSNTYALQEVTPNGSSYQNVNGVYKRVKVSSADLGFPRLERSYKAVDLFLERPWDGKWEARIDYTFSKSKGNSEGPANSDTGQGSNAHDNGVATSQNWDAWQIMQYADGYLPNDRRHQLKARVSYAITPEWIVGVNARISSGAPISCFGYYDPDGTIAHDSAAADPIGYGSSYHTCFGEAWPPGKETSPWLHRYDLAVTYKPAYFDDKLALNISVFNVLNERKPTSYVQTSEDDGPYSVNNNYMLPVSFSTPRYVQFSASYDW
ncbi:outer membrane receptor for ferrienterochelin and colicin [Pseudoxanthomonas sp. SORGH_AS 997]|uniref:Outer membrane receptor for ferrienterochelin and colicin n=2 Tax=Lysobacteraceae TaxID=32033 RepID=A0AAW8G9P9_9GAMM|nr:outer membrane receptor for ferrienterochelin and colicin [Pseudoxanthomonas winnipegensis]MDQ1131479.1 outer membrane receptor for ferrienterochelin and colicin [Pseudoxanthomonas winnipegensis]MDR6138503.1 outer membrane receptor for ferrienterochelin and colicin [Pseudoxanthomonas sp. SORGH_AS_0997]